MTDASLKAVSTPSIPDEPRTTAKTELAREQLIRYSRQLRLPDVTAADQQRLLNTRVALIGLGGLGSPTALYLASSGIGHLTLCDGDNVELSNLHRQLLHSMADLGRNKCDSAQDRLRSINPVLSITKVPEYLAGPVLDTTIASCDLVVDASDNFPTRFAVNASCARHLKPLLSGSVIRMEGQASMFRHDLLHAPCYRCLYSPDEDNLFGSCDGEGILAPVAGIIGTIMATETLKFVLTGQSSLDGQLLQVDARQLNMKLSLLRNDPSCPTCAARRTSP
ncbi:MAG: HesA/MoeB/ThiF family protein [Gammaproteobacteria bacterium]|nr:HesA/MoeB/ThiF family protein [Gammaproteobacteria bacterium]